MSEWEKRVEHFARCRAYVLQAVHGLIKERKENPEWNGDLGPTYIDIRAWIREHKRFEMENVGARVRELARSIKPTIVRIEYDSSGRVHVYPIE